MKSFQEKKPWNRNRGMAKDGPRPEFVNGKTPDSLEVQKGTTSDLNNSDFFRFTNHRFGWFHSHVGIIEGPMIGYCPTYWNDV